jgi:Zn-dependent M32 family carboxypeptidase
MIEIEGGDFMDEKFISRELINLQNKIKSMDFGNMKKDMPKLDIALESISNQVMSQLSQSMSIAARSSEMKMQYDQEVLKTLKNIERNTAGLNDVIPLLVRSVENQETIAELLKESIDIAASKTKEEAESKWRKVMDKANQLTADFETIKAIQGFANTVMELAQKMFT